MTEIRNLTGPHAFLSRDHHAPIVVAGATFPRPLTFPTVTHALIAARTTDFAARERIAAASTVAEAKRIGMTLEQRPDYDQIKDAAARNLVRLSSRQHPQWAAQLLATNDAMIVYENDINDRYWGRDRATGRGLNRWGEILMDERARLREAQAHQKTAA